MQDNELSDCADRLVLLAASRFEAELRHLMQADALRSLLVASVAAASARSSELAGS